MPLFALMLLFLSSFLTSYPGHAQPLITEAEARAAFGRIYNIGCGVVIPVGNYEFPLPDASPGGPHHQFVLNLKALDQIGAVRITHHPGLIGFARFSVELNQNINKSDYYEEPHRKCIRNYKTPPILKFLSIEPVKGGRTNWSGAIASYTAAFDRTELAKRFNAAANRLTDPVLKSRALFTYDIFQRKWTFVTLEAASLDKPFTSSNISEALKRD